MGRSPSLAGRLRLNRRLTLPTLRGLTRLAVIALTAIVATGGAVRLTRSGLGCDSWPDCGKADGWHALVEYGNRLAGVAVGVVIVTALVGVYRLAERRTDLEWLAWALVVGFFCQAALGALSVALKLPPGVVVAHFLLSMILVAIAAVLHSRTRPWREAPVARPEVRWLSVALLAATAVVLLLGTLTTGTGPHSGANPTQPAPRFTFLALHVISMVHGNAAILVVGLAIANFLVVRITGADHVLTRSARLVVGAVVVQALIGITQYALGLPRGLVEIHMVGAVLLWLAVIGHHLAVRQGAAQPVPVPAFDVPAHA